MGSDGSMSNHAQAVRRRTTQLILPLHHRPSSAGVYDIYPAYDLPGGCIGTGYRQLARRLSGEPVVVIDGFAGIIWDSVRHHLDDAFRAEGKNPRWHCADDALIDARRREEIIRPFLGGDDPLWGTRFDGSVLEFFDASMFPPQPAPGGNAIDIIYGTGASLSGWRGHVVYFDLPKNELQFRARAGMPTNLGLRVALPPKVAYKRSYFVDWPALGELKRRVLPSIGTFVDGQRGDVPVFTAGDTLRDALRTMSRTIFRVRPWFEPGPWGGDWMKRHINALPQAAPNYAWSFELIAPENGLLLRSDDVLLEMSFDLLMFAHADDVLGSAHERFGLEFPIRFDYLDTYNGGNLSVQCHPRTEYIRKHFGETFTQDETYYMVDSSPGARVYLGFTADADVDAFRSELEESARTGTPVDIDRYVNSEPAHQGDLFLIPNGTIHCSGVNNLVLEISATPYIFTFKMYDWVRRDLEGNLRPLNIKRAWDNLYFERRGARIRDEFVSKPKTISSEPGRRLIHLPTHREHFYDVVRYEFEQDFECETDGNCHVMNLVEGESIVVETEHGGMKRISFAESFVVPAAAGRYRIVNEGRGEAKVVRAWVKTR